jgi:hypothetical protein
MSVGIPVAKADVDNRAGGLAVQLRNDLAQCVSFKAWLDSVSDGFLTGLGYTSGEITTLRGSFVDLNKLSNIAHALDTQTPASDFFFNAKLLTGVV